MTTTYRKIEDVTLRSSEVVELGVVTGPDHDWGKRVRHLLGHKDEICSWQIDQSLFNPHIGVESRFYVLSKDGLPFANVMTAERMGVGILGHVYTAPEHRQKGAADILHGCQMADFRVRQGRALYLGTSYGTHAYRLYQKHGFIGCEPNSDAMFYFANGQEAFEAQVFSPGPATIEQLAFKHWPLLPALAMKKHPARIRILGMGVTRIMSTELGSLEYLAAIARSDQSLDARVAVSDATHIPVALACRRPEMGGFGRHVDLVDVFAAQGHEPQIPRLITSLNLGSSRKAICYVDHAWPEKGKWLREARFQREAVLKGHTVGAAKQLLDVEIWSR